MEQIIVLSRAVDRELNIVSTRLRKCNISTVVRAVRSTHLHEGTACCNVARISVCYLVINCQVRNPVAYTEAEVVLKSRDICLKVNVEVLDAVSVRHRNRLEIYSRYIQKAYFFVLKDRILSEAACCVCTCLIVFYLCRSALCGLCRALLSSAGAVAVTAGSHAHSHKRSNCNTN